MNICKVGNKRYPVCAHKSNCGNGLVECTFKGNCKDKQTSEEMISDLENKLSEVGV